MEITDVYRHMAENIHYLRVKSKMTQAALASQLGIGVSSLRRLENGDIPNRFRCHCICRVCNIFHISADTLLMCSIETLDNL